MYISFYVHVWVVYFSVVGVLFNASIAILNSFFLKLFTSAAFHPSRASSGTCNTEIKHHIMCLKKPVVGECCTSGYFIEERIVEYRYRHVKH